MTALAMLEPVMKSKKVAIVQSNYIPWKGYFDLIQKVDEFILLDSVQYTRRDWRNRNRIKRREGVIWLTIPVKVTGKYFQSIRETEVSDPSWAEQHWVKLKLAYGKAPYFPTYSARLEALYDKASTFQLLSEVNFLFLTELCKILEISTKITIDSHYQSSGAKTERLVSLCQGAGATEYLSGPAAQDYLLPNLFNDVGIQLSWMDYAGYPEYSQLYPPFDHSVSILDLLFQTGPEAKRYFQRGPGS